MPTNLRDKEDRMSEFGHEMKHKARDAAQTVKDEASSLADKARQAGQTLKDQAANTASSLADKARDAASNVATKAGDAASYVGHKAQDATAAVGCGMESLAGTVRENLPRSGMIGSASGAVADTLESGGHYLKEHGLSGICSDVSAMIRRNPMPALFVGIGIGFILARATSRS